MTSTATVEQCVTGPPRPLSELLARLGLHQAWCETFGRHAAASAIGQAAELLTEQAELLRDVADYLNALHDADAVRLRTRAGELGR